jgi:hypothetical protein
MTRNLVVGVLAAFTLSACGNTATHPHSESYNQGYKVAHDFYADPKEREGWKQQTPGTFNVAASCAKALSAANPQPFDIGQWQLGCKDAMHDYGMKP